MPSPNLNERMYSSRKGEEMGNDTMEIASFDLADANCFPIITHPAPLVA